MNFTRLWTAAKYDEDRWMNLLRRALSQIGDILVLYLRLLILTIVLYAIIYGYLKYFDGISLTDVASNSSLDSNPSAIRSDL